MENIEDEKSLVPYGEHYTEEKLFDKILKVAKKAGIKVIYAALLLYYALMSNHFPAKEKAIILGALGYFILPLDLIPDAIPLAGFTDDLLALVFAVRTVYNHITPEEVNKAKATVRKLFGEIEEKEFNLF